MIYILVSNERNEVTAVTTSIKRVTRLSKEEKGGAEIYVVNTSDFNRVFSRNRAMVEMLKKDELTRKQERMAEQRKAIKEKQHEKKNLQKAKTT